TALPRQEGLATKAASRLQTGMAAKAAPCFAPSIPSHAANSVQTWRGAPPNVPSCPLVICRRIFFHGHVLYSQAPGVRAHAIHVGLIQRLDTRGRQKKTANGIKPYGVFERGRALRQVLVISTNALERTLDKAGLAAEPCSAVCSGRCGSSGN